MREAPRGAPTFFRLLTHSQAVSSRRASKPLQVDNRIHDRIQFAMDRPYFDETMRSRIRMLILLHSYLWTLPASRNYLTLRAAFVGKRNPGVALDAARIQGRSSRTILILVTAPLYLPHPRITTYPPAWMENCPEQPRPPPNECRPANLPRRRNWRHSLQSAPFSGYACTSAATRNVRHGKRPARGISSRSALRFRTGTRWEPEALSDARVQVLRYGDTTVRTGHSRGPDATSECCSGRERVGRVFAKRTQEGAGRSLARSRKTGMLALLRLRSALRWR